MFPDREEPGVYVCLMCGRELDTLFRQPLALPSQEKRNYEPREGRRPKTGGVRL